MNGCYYHRNTDCACADRTGDPKPQTGDPKPQKTKSRHSFKFHGETIGRLHTIEMDGRELKGVRDIQIRSNFNEATTITLEIIPEEIEMVLDDLSDLPVNVKVIK